MGPGAPVFDGISFRGTNNTLQLRIVPQSNDFALSHVKK